MKPLMPVIMKKTYRVRFSSKQQLLMLPLAWLEQAVNGIEEASTCYFLVYHDPRLAFQVALVTDGTVVPERESVAHGVVAGEPDLPFFTN